MNRLEKLLGNVRFYILASLVLLSVFIAAYTRLHIPGDTLYYIRTEQLYGLLSLLLLYFSIILTPISKLLGKRPWLEVFLFSRRATGVAAAYFAFLHIYISFFQQSGGFAGYGVLPSRFKWAFILGVLGLLILLAMAATSFDRAIKAMSFRRWKVLHRFVYLAGVVIVVHVWLIGTHMENTTLKVAATLALLLLFGLEALRMGTKIASKKQWSQKQRWLTSAVFFGLLAGSLWALPLLTKSYHNENHAHGETSSES